MLNKTIIETFNVLTQLDDDSRGMPLKFVYGLCKNRARLERVVNDLQALQQRKIEGQDEYNEARVAILTRMAEKDDNGAPITKQTPQGTEYAIEDREALAEAMAELDEDHSNVVAGLSGRHADFLAVLEDEATDFEPYMIDVKNLPVDSDGNTKLTVTQLRHLMPFLEGDI